MLHVIVRQSGSRTAAMRVVPLEQLRELATVCCLCVEYRAPSALPLQEGVAGVQCLLECVQTSSTVPVCGRFFALGLLLLASSRNTLASGSHLVLLGRQAAAPADAYTSAKDACQRRSRILVGPGR